MLERLVAWVLNSYIGDYFGNVNTDQLSVALHQGEVELEKLPLKVQALKKLDLSIDIKAGFISKIKIKIPLYRLRTDPWLIFIDDLYILAGPITNFEYNEEEEKQISQDFKLSLLQEMERKFQSQYESNENKSYYASSYFNWFSFGSSVVSHIIENLQLKINNVHLRYEDEISIPNTCFSCGLIIQALTTQSTDDFCQSVYTQADKSIVTKKSFYLEGFSVYWDNDVLLIKQIDMDNFIPLMRDLISCKITKENFKETHAYLLNTVNGKAFIERTSFNHPSKSSDISFLCDFQIERFALKLNSLQYKQMLNWHDVLELTNRLWKHRKWRPLMSIKENPVLWWKYAINANLQKRRDNKSINNWTFLSNRVKDIIKYCDIYYLYLTDFDSLTKDMEELKDRIEYNLNFNELAPLREIVFRKIRKNRENVSLKTNNSYWSLQSWLWGWSFQQPEQESIDDLFDISLESHLDYQNVIDIVIKFQVPQLLLEIVYLDDDIEQSLALLVMQDFFLLFKKTQEYESEAEIVLKSLIMEDMLAPLHSSHRYLMSSKVDQILEKRKELRKYNFLSMSCPTTPQEFSFSSLSKHTSLPSKLQKANIYHLMPYSGPKKNRCKPNLSDEKIEHQNKLKFDHSYLNTPPFSTVNKDDQQKHAAKKRKFIKIQNDDKEECNNLVKIHIQFVDESSPNFQSFYKSNHQIINIKFNSLETTINLQTWAKILNFFDPMTHKRLIKENFSFSNESLNLNNESQVKNLSNVDESLKISMNCKIDLVVRHLSIVLNRSENDPLAKANISGFSCSYAKKNSSIVSKGKLKNLSIIDLTKYGKMFRERFITSGDEALRFNLFKYTENDPHMKRNYDMSLNIKMALVQYVHSQRFYSETIEFLKHLNYLRINLPTEASTTHPHFHRSTRISLTVNAAAPVIIIPVNYLSENVLVADFGHLTVRNKFLFSGSPKTNGTVCKKSGLAQSDIIPFSNLAKSGVITRASFHSYTSGDTKKVCPSPCLLDVLNVELTEMDLYSGLVISNYNCPNSLSKESVLNFPSFKIKRQPGRILKERFMLQLQIERNLESNINHSLPDISMIGKFSAVHCTISSFHYQLIRGIFENNLGEPLDHLLRTPLSIVEREGLNAFLPNQIWTSLAIYLDLKNVTLEIIDTSECLNKNDKTEKFLARIDFLSSKLSIESYTDSSRDVDLISQEIKIVDSRYFQDLKNRPNVFPNILLPAKKSLLSNPLQFEIHYRSKHNNTCLTILLNNLRVMAIFDWFKEVGDFLSQPVNFSNSFNKNENNYASQILDVHNSQLPNFELKLNVTDTELVVVENSLIKDTNAVILKGTAIFSLATDMNHPEPFNCTLEGIEVFSCILGVEEETALSIIDPLNVTIDLSHRLINHQSIKQKGHSEQMVLIFDISEISLRLSYQDMFLFLKILNSLPKQTKVLSNSNNSSKPSPMEMKDIVFALPSHVEQLHMMGFKRKDCINALEACQGNINEAAFLLSQNLINPPQTFNNYVSDDNFEKRLNRFSKFNFNVISVQIHSGILCLIDDCKDTDVPLFEIRFTGLDLWQRLGSHMFGVTNFTISGDYFNRSLSGWQPILESWKCEMNWNIEKNEQGLLKKVFIGLNSFDTLNIVITNTCLDLYKNVIKSWTDDYHRLSKQMNKPIIRHRSPFIPFAIKNQTGCDIRFYMVTSNIDDFFSLQPKISNNSYASKQFKKINLVKNTTEPSLIWNLVKPNETFPFSFDGPAKIRHRNSHQLKSHKIVVQVNGWHPVFPVSVDKVGKYFREAKPEDSRYETVRIVFDIVLESNARKMITVRSALLLFNGTQNEMEVKFGFSLSSLTIMPQTIIPIPLQLIRSKIFAKPKNFDVSMCKKPIIWDHMKKPYETFSELMTCPSLSISKSNSKLEELCYKFVTVVIRDNFPLDNNQQGPGIMSLKALPGHQISLLPPLQLINLLPFELKYEFKNIKLEASIKPGQSDSIQYVDTSKEFTLIFNIDNYPKCTPFTISPGFPNDFTMHLELFDKRDRPLYLQAQLFLVANSPYALQIQIIAPNWLINQTGLPLIFKQEASEKEASGQFEEHEVARNMMPLLFSFYDTEAPLACLMRLGKSFGRARWCSGFYLQKKTMVRKLRIASDDPRRPDKVYEIGIEVRNGKGRYRDTNMVVLAPRYQIENSSSYRLDITQKFATNNKTDLKENLITVLPNSNAAFHWPRSDQDRLLCVRISSFLNCHWSGGFAVQVNSSFHLNIRDFQRKLYFLRLEILSQGATIFIVFSDTVNLPPSIRIDNFSEVPIEFYQTNTQFAWMKTTVRPKSSQPYAWDESTLKPHLTVCAPGGCCATYDINSLKLGDNISYENFFYIAFTGTFFSSTEEDNELTVYNYSVQDINSMMLVLDVPEGSEKVIINRKEPGRRSQLWKMDESKRLIHEGSSPPKDPRKSSKIKLDKNIFVLDISAHCPLPGKYSTLVLKKIDNKRSLTQCWHFDKNGRLTSEYPYQYVQPKNGFLGLVIGNEVVLGPTQSITYSKLDGGVPFEQAICIQKMRKGSGMLSAQVCTDGPTRVLQIMDVKDILSIDRNMRSPYVLKHGNHSSLISNDCTNYELNFLLKPSCVGFSLVNQFNEEIIYFYLQEMVFEYQYKIIEHKFNCSVRYMQADNQLREAEKQIIFHTVNLDVSHPMAGLPALNIFVHKLVLPQVEAQFFEDVQITIKDICLNLEELLILKVYEFLGYPCSKSEPELEEEEKEGQNAHKAITSALAKSLRIYFSILQLNLENVKLSVITTSHLPSKLNQIKKKIRLRLMRFEEANIIFMPFRKNYSLETFQFLIEAIISHYKWQLIGQAAKILGSVDILGNISGFANDVSDGISELIYEGNVGGLILNLAHGISDSTAKFTSVLSDGLGSVTMDERHQEIRKRIKNEGNNNLKAGIKRLGVGILGGFTSILTQTYEGTVNEGGVQGFFSGLGKGLLGTITKPAVGMLDLATGAAIAVRDSSRKISNHAVVEIGRIRLPRCRFSVHGCGSILPRYSVEQAIGQEFFYKSTVINDKEDDEVFLCFQMLRSDSVAFITNLRVHFINWSENVKDRGKAQLTINFEHLIECKTDTNLSTLEVESMHHFLVLKVVDESCAQGYGNYHILGKLGSKKPKIRCQSEQIALQATQQINYAKASFEESKYTLISKV